MSSSNSLDDVGSLLQGLEQRIQRCDDALVVAREETRDGLAAFEEVLEDIKQTFESGISNFNEDQRTVISELRERVWDSEQAMTRIASDLMRRIERVEAALSANLSGDSTVLDLATAASSLEDQKERNPLTTTSLHIADSQSSRTPALATHSVTGMPLSYLGESLDGDGNQSIDGPCDTHTLERSDGTCTTGNQSASDRISSELPSQMSSQWQACLDDLRQQLGDLRIKCDKLEMVRHTSAHHVMTGHHETSLQKPENRHVAVLEKSDSTLTPCSTCQVQLSIESKERQQLADNQLTMRYQLTNLEMRIDAIHNQNADRLSHDNTSMGTDTPPNADYTPTEPANHETVENKRDDLENINRRLGDCLTINESIKGQIEAISSEVAVLHCNLEQERDKVRRLEACNSGGIDARKLEEMIEVQVKKHIGALNQRLDDARNHETNERTHATRAEKLLLASRLREMEMKIENVANKVESDGKGLTREWEKALGEKADILEKQLTDLKTETMDELMRMKEMVMQTTMMQLHQMESKVKAVQSMQLEALKDGERRLIDRSEVEQMRLERMITELREKNATTLEAVKGVFIRESQDVLTKQGQAIEQRLCQLLKQWNDDGYTSVFESINRDVADLMKALNETQAEHHLWHADRIAGIQLEMQRQYDHMKKVLSEVFKRILGKSTQYPNASEDGERNTLSPTGTLISPPHTPLHRTSVSNKEVVGEGPQLRPVDVEEKMLAMNEDINVLQTSIDTAQCDMQLMLTDIRALQRNVRELYQLTSSEVRQGMKSKVDSVMNRDMRERNGNVFLSTATQTNTSQPLSQDNSRAQTDMQTLLGLSSNHDSPSAHNADLFKGMMLELTKTVDTQSDNISLLETKIVRIDRLLELCEKRVDLIGGTTKMIEAVNAEVSLHTADMDQVKGVLVGMQDRLVALEAVMSEIHPRNNQVSSLKQSTLDSRRIGRSRNQDGVGSELHEMNVIGDSFGEDASDETADRQRKMVKGFKTTMRLPLNALQMNSTPNPSLNIANQAIEDEYSSTLSDCGKSDNSINDSHGSSYVITNDDGNETLNCSASSIGSSPHSHPDIVTSIPVPFDSKSQMAVNAENSNSMENDKPEIAQQTPTPPKLSSPTSPLFKSCGKQTLTLSSRVCKRSRSATPTKRASTRSQGASVLRPRAGTTTNATEVTYDPNATDITTPNITSAPSTITPSPIQPSCIRSASLPRWKSQVCVPGTASTTSVKSLTPKHDSSPTFESTIDVSSNGHSNKTKRERRSQSAPKKRIPRDINSAIRLLEDTIKDYDDHTTSERNASCSRIDSNLNSNTTCSSTTSSSNNAHMAPFLETPLPMTVDEILEKVKHRRQGLPRRLAYGPPFYHLSESGQPEDLVKNIWPFSGSNDSVHVTDAVNLYALQDDTKWKRNRLQDLPSLPITYANIDSIINDDQLVNYIGTDGGSTILDPVAHTANNNTRNTLRLNTKSEYLWIRPLTMSQSADIAARRIITKAVTMDASDGTSPPSNMATPKNNTISTGHRTTTSQSSPLPYDSSSLAERQAPNNPLSNTVLSVTPTYKVRGPLEQTVSPGTDSDSDTAFGSNPLTLSNLSHDIYGNKRTGISDEYKIANKSSSGKGNHVIRQINMRLEELYIERMLLLGEITHEEAMQMLAAIRRKSIELQDRAQAEERLQHDKEDDKVNIHNSSVLQSDYEGKVTKYSHAATSLLGIRDLANDREWMGRTRHNVCMDKHKLASIIQ